MGNGGKHKEKLSVEEKCSAVVIINAQKSGGGTDGGRKRAEVGQDRKYCQFQGLERRGVVETVKIQKAGENLT